MMQLLCDGQYLDLYADASIQFTHDNPLFAFDDLKCERTTNFKLPSTPKNDSIFALARMPQNYGLGMRRKFAAQLQMSGLVKDGYLYLTSYDGKDYNSIFVTGDLVGLLNVKSVGKLSDVLPKTDVLQYTGTDESAAVEWFNGYFMRQYKYRQAQNIVSSPSSSVRQIIARICSDYGISIQVPSVYSKLAMVTPYAQTMKEAQIAFENKGYNVLPALEDDPSDPSNDLTADLVLLQQQDVSMITYVKDHTNRVYQDWSYLVRTLMPTQNLTLSFPSDFPTSLFLVKIISNHAGGFDDVEFLGDYSFVKYRSSTDSVDINTGACVTSDPGEVTGEPLRGKSVDVQKGDKLLFVTTDDYCAGWNDSSMAYYKDDWAFTQHDWSASIKVQGTNAKAEIGETIRLVDNVPDITFTELLKILAAVNGKVLNFANNTILFEDLDTTNYPRFDTAGRLLERKDVERVFSNYAQRNTVAFEKDETQRAADVLSIAYTIENDNIDAEKELLNIPLSCADMIVEDGETRAYINNDYQDPSEYALMMLTGTGGDTYMHRVSLPICAGLQALCDASTQIKISVRMTVLEYEQITAKTLLLVDGVLYLWTSRSWQKDEAQFTLAKVP